MATINFPSNPVLNQEYTFNGKTWRWNGTGWVLTFPNNTINGYPISGNPELVLNDLIDVTINNPVSGNILAYDFNTLTWKNTDIGILINNSVSSGTVSITFDGGDLG
jgi:hypothetical protein